MGSTRRPSVFCEKRREGKVDAVDFVEIERVTGLLLTTGQLESNLNPGEVNSIGASGVWVAEGAFVAARGA